MNLITNILRPQLGTNTNRCSFKQDSCLKKQMFNVSKNHVDRILTDETRFFYTGIVADSWNARAPGSIIH
jgi:hypothetical protein